ncbi:dienelactone hydrolase family protein [Pseudoteredinibacter isoporae]|uniref:Carboxymethylenebutenolidase n=1 Tax=Pseudoteredinibacter isoporae TaxID=570281 RepID=A0A7X0MXU0_9GAMM|nr:dienelactone hydrolase family protein [Pseudoteredinibacter isoporae]MBB6523833.1 carboxymethylenebutenolidase [Pseudoteredinibacter isoporae]
MTEQDAKQYLLNEGKINRRGFNKLGVAAFIAAVLPKAAYAGAVTETRVEVTTPDGIADCYFVHPSSGKHPGVLLWPDIKGLRPVYELIGKRLAEAGYSVLVVNPYYRDAKAPVVAPDASFSDPEIMDTLRNMAWKLTEKVVSSDAKAYINFLDGQPSVDVDRKIGTFGYCMAGELVVLTAAAVPDRVGAVASFHGSRSMVTDGANSPHLLISKSSAPGFHAVAENDDQRSPETKNIIKAAYDDAGIPVEIEVYEGTLHGWCTPDFHGYHEQQAERAWARLLHLFKGALA